MWYVQTTGIWQKINTSITEGHPLVVINSSAPCLIPKNAFGGLWVIRRVTALGGTGKYDSKDHSPWHPVLGCAIPHQHHPIPKKSWAEDSVLNCLEKESDPAAGDLSEGYKPAAWKCQSRNCGGDCRGWRAPNFPIFPKTVHAWVFPWGGIFIFIYFYLFTSVFHMQLNCDSHQSALWDFW